MRARSAFIVSASTLAVLLAVVACGPTQDHVTIGQQTVGPYSLAVASCKGSLRSSLEVYVGRGKTKPTVNVCQIVEGQDGKTSLSLQPTPVVYRISKGSMSAVAAAPVPAPTKAATTQAAQPDDANSDSDSDSETGANDSSGNVGATVSIALSISTSDALTNDDQTVLLNRFHSDCVEKTQAIFAKSSLTSFGPLSFKPNVTYQTNEGLGDTPTDDPSLFFTKQQDNTGSFYTMEQAPGARFYVNGKTADIEACKAAKAKNPRSIEAATTCAKGRDARLKANLPFCAQFAHLTGQWLGLVDVKQEASKCNVPSEPAKTEAKDLSKPATTEPAVPAVTISSTFVSQASTSAEDYFDNAKLSEADILTILKPVCADLGSFQK